MTRTLENRKRFEAMLKKEEQHQTIFASDSLGRLDVLVENKSPIGFAVHGEVPKMEDEFKQAKTKSGQPKMVENDSGERVPAYIRERKPGKKHSFFRTAVLADKAEYKVLYFVEGSWAEEKPSDASKVEDVAIITVSRTAKTNRTSVSGFTMVGKKLEDVGLNRDTILKLIKHDQKTEAAAPENSISEESSEEQNDGDEELEGDSPEGEDEEEEEEEESEELEEEAPGA